MHLEPNPSLTESPVRIFLVYKKQPEVRTAEMWLPWFEEDARDLSSRDPLDETVNRWVELGEGGQLIGRTARDHQVGLCVELIAPQPSRSKGFFLEFWPKMVMKPARKHEDSRGSPAKRHDCRSLVGGTVNASHDDPALQDCLFRFTLDLAEIIRRMVRLTECSFDGSKRCPKQTGIAVQPEPSIRIEAGLNIEGGGTTRCFRCTASSHAPTVSRNYASRKSQ